MDAVVVPQRDPQALAHAVEGLLQDRQRRLGLGARAAAKLRSQFDVEVHEKPFHDRLREIVLGGRAVDLP